MATSRAKTVAEYLSELPADRRKALQAVRRVILDNLDSGYEEGMQYGMIGYYVPHRLYPAGYHCDPKQPLPFASLASQKNHMALYMMCLYSHGDGPGKQLTDRFVQSWNKTGKKLDMGKACIRFKNVEALALDVIGETIKQVPAKEWIRNYELSRGVAAASKGSAAAASATVRKATKKKAASKSAAAGGKVTGKAPAKRTAKSTATSTEKTTARTAKNATQRKPATSKSAKAKPAASAVRRKR